MGWRGALMRKIGGDAGVEGGIIRLAIHPKSSDTSHIPSAAKAVGLWGCFGPTEVGPFPRTVCDSGLRSFPGTDLPERVPRRALTEPDARRFPGGRFGGIDPPGGLARRDNLRRVEARGRAPALRDRTTHK